VYFFGNRITKGDANFGPGGKTIAAGSYKPNAFGLYDMHGNVWERCEDWYGANYPAGTVTDPKGPETGNYRVLRGGSYDGVSSARSSDRGYITPSARLSAVTGVRLVRTP